MVNNDWIKKFLQAELETIAIALNRRNLRDVACYLAGRLEQQHLTLVPTFLSDEMFEIQKKVNPTLSYTEASQMYSCALVDYSHRASQVEEPEEIQGSFW
jgi:hypothetical protein